MTKTRVHRSWDKDFWVLIQPRPCPGGKKKQETVLNSYYIIKTKWSVNVTSLKLVSRTTRLYYTKVNYLFDMINVFKVSQKWHITRSDKTICNSVIQLLMCKRLERYYNYTPKGFHIKIWRNDLFMTAVSMWLMSLMNNSSSDLLPTPTLVQQQQSDVWHLLCKGSPAYPGAVFSLYLGDRSCSTCQCTEGQNYRAPGCFSSASPGHCCGCVPMWVQCPVGNGVEHLRT